MHRERAAHESLALASSIDDLFETPDAFMIHTRRYTGSIMLAIIFGIRCPDHSSKILAAYSALNSEINSFYRQGAHPPMDLIPILKYIPAFLPWGSWKRQARNIKERQSRILSGLADACRSRMTEGKRNGSFMESLVDEQKSSHGLEDNLIIALSKLSSSTP